MAISWHPDSSFQPINRGGDGWVARPSLSPDRGGHHVNGSNAFLQRINPSSGQDERVYLWVNEVTSDFQLAGTMAQSKRRRNFYAHNFVQPSLTISGQTPNSYQYNRLAMFVRQNQLDSVRLETSKVDDFLRFFLWKTGDSAKRGIRGKHLPIDLNGYVRMMPAGAERFVNAPDYQFEFVIVRANLFLGLEDQIVPQTVLRSMTAIVKENKKTGVTYVKMPKPIAAKGESSAPSDTNPSFTPDAGSGTALGSPGERPT